MIDGSRSAGNGEPLRTVADFIDDLANARLGSRDLLTAATTALSEFRSGTWVAVLMSKNLSAPLVVSADGSDRSLADYVAGVLAALDRLASAPSSSLSVRVIETGRQVYLPNLPYRDFVSMLTEFEQAYVNEHPPPIEPGSLDVLIVPMHSRGAIIGTLGLFERDPSNPITERDTPWFQAVADRIGVATENAQLYEDAIVRLDRLRSMYSVSRAVSASLDLTFVLNVILKQVVGQLKVDAADVLLIDESDGMLATVASEGFVATAVLDFRLPIDEGLPGRALTSRHFESMTTPSDFPQVRRRSLFAREGFRAYGAVPVAVRGGPAGVIEIFHRSVLNPDQEWLSFLEAMACVAATSVDIARLHERLRTADSINRSGKARIKAPELSRVEWDIFKMLVEGQTNREISQQVHLSQNTVKFHVGQMLQKTGAANRTDLTRQAIRQGWL